MVCAKAVQARMFLGDAPLNFAVNCIRLGDSAALISAVGADERGRRIREAAASLGVETQSIREYPGHATGIANVGTTPGGEPTFHIPRPAAFDFLEYPTDLISASKPDWLYFGTLAQTNEGVAEVTRRVAESDPHLRCFYDMNLRPDSLSLADIQRLSRMATIVKLNEVEAVTLGRLMGIPEEQFTLEFFCEQWAGEFVVDTVCLTLGPAGCMVYCKSDIQTIPGFSTTVQDTVGAGDAFAAAFLHGFHRGWPITVAARFANALGSIVAGRAGATPDWTVDECLALAGMTRREFDAS